MSLNVIQLSAPLAAHIHTVDLQLVYQLERQQVSRQVIFAERPSTDRALVCRGSAVAHELLETCSAESVLAWRHFWVLEHFSADHTEKHSRNFGAITKVPLYRWL